MRQMELAHKHPLCVKFCLSCSFHKIIRKYIHGWNDSSFQSANLMEKHQLQFS